MKPKQLLPNLKCACAGRPYLKQSRDRSTSAWEVGLLPRCLRDGIVANAWSQDKVVRHFRQLTTQGPLTVLHASPFTTSQIWGFSGSLRLRSLDYIHSCLRYSCPCNSSNLPYLGLIAR